MIQSNRQIPDDALSTGDPLRVRKAIGDMARTQGLGLAAEQCRSGSDDDLLTQLAKVNSGDTSDTRWHKPMLAATATMIGRGWSDILIKLACASKCEGGFNDSHLPPLIDEARIKWDKPDGEDAVKIVAAPSPPKGSERLFAKQLRDVSNDVFKGVNVKSTMLNPTTIPTRMPEK